MSIPFFKCSKTKFHTVAAQPERFIAGFSPTYRAKLAVACESIANAYEEGVPQVRSRLVREAKLHDLFAIYVDWWHAGGSKKILLARRDGDRVLVARGFESAEGEIPEREVERAERALEEARADDRGKKGVRA